MKGSTFLIIQDLKQDINVEDISKKYKLTVSSIYKIAKKYNISLSHLTAEEKKQHRKISDAKYQKEKAFAAKEKLFAFERPDIPLPELPLVAMKSKGLGACNNSWVYSQGDKKSSLNEHIKTQIKFGLKCSYS